MLPLVVTAVIVTVYYTQGHSLLEETCPKRYYLDITLKGDRVCRQCTPCKPGYRLVTHCSKVVNTYCEPCRPGTYASHNAKRCRSCTNCRRGSKHARSCRNKDRAQCPCPKGTYYSEGACIPCTKCLAGLYVKSNCRYTKDTQCNECPQGTFSEIKDVSFCRKCSDCRKGELIVQSCKSTSNTVCGECRPGMFRLASTGECAPCSPCYPDIYGSLSNVIIIEECRRRNPDQSKICMPTFTKSLVYISNNTDVGSTTSIPEETVVEPLAPGRFFEGDPGGLRLFIAACIVIALTFFVLLSLCLACIHRNIAACRECLHFKQPRDDQHVYRNLMGDYLTEQRSSTSDRITKSNSALLPFTRTSIKRAGTALSLETGLMHYFTEDEFQPSVRWNIGGKRTPSVTSYSDILSVSATGTLSSSKGAEN